MTREVLWYEKIVVAPAISSDEQTKALIVRALSFYKSGRVDVDALVDGNDFQATHFLAKLDKKVIGSARVRWFCDFAKFERSCLLEPYRHPKAIKAIATQVFSHIEKKGFETVLTCANPTYARLWRSMLGFKNVTEKTEFNLGISDEPFVELVKELNPPKDKFTRQSPSIELERIEGQWQQPLEYELVG